MFRAIGRWFRSLGYLMSGRIDASARRLETDPQAMRAKYDDVIREKTARIQQYKQAVAGIVAQQEQKMAQLERLTEEVGRLENLKAGALAKAQQRVGELKGQGADKGRIQSDDDYQKCLAAFNDFSSTLEEKQARIREHEVDVEDYGKRIKEHTLQLEELRKDIDKLRVEMHEAVADVISASQEKELNDAMSGLGEDRSTEKLGELRRMRAEVKAEARVSRELAGTDHKLAEAEFMEYARQNVANSEFEQLVGLAEEADAPAPAAPEADRDDREAATKAPERLPE